MKPFGFIPFLLLCKIGGMTMNEYRRIMLPLLQEKLLLISAICSGIVAAILNLSRPLFMGLIVDNLIQRELKGTYVYIALFAPWLCLAYWYNSGLNLPFLATVVRAAALHLHMIMDLG